MPIYEYICKECGEVFEKVVSFSEADQTPVCPKCNSEQINKKISTIATPSAFSESSGGGCGSGGGFS